MDTGRAHSLAHVHHRRPSVKVVSRRLTNSRPQNSLQSQNSVGELALLREVRLAKEVSQAELASRLNLEQTHVSRIERGGPRLDVLELRGWLQALACDPVAFHVELETRLARATAGKVGAKPVSVPVRIRKIRKL